MPGERVIDLGIVSVAWLLYALAAAACVVVALRAVRITRGVRALTVLLSQQALSTVAAVLAFTATSPVVAVLAFRVGVILWLLWAPCIALVGAALMHDARRERMAWVLAALTGGPNVLAVLALILRPSIAFAPDGLSVTPLAAGLISMAFVAMAVFALLLAFEARTSALPLRKAQLWLITLALTGEGMFHAAQNAMKAGLGLDVHGYASAGVVLKATLFAPFGLQLLLLGLAIVAAIETRDLKTRRGAGILAGFLLVSAATGVATAPLGAGDEFNEPIGMFHALWDFASLLILVFAGLRYQLFAFHMRARQGVAVALAVTLGFMVFVTAESLAQEFVQDQYLAGLPANNVISGIVVALALLPVAKLGETVSRRMFPDAARPGGARRDKEQIYQAALEGSLLDGAITPKEVRSLVRLRETLGLSDDDHERIEERLRATLKKAPVSPA